MADCVIRRIEALAAARGVDVRAMLVGSAARGTWLAGDYDLDIFIGVPPEGDLTQALEIARMVAPDHEERYAEHPYVHAWEEGFDLDLVPFFLLEDATDLKCAVDRTPFHTRYLKARMDGLQDDVLLLKQFMKGVGVYGSELKTGGFSGYLSELLVLHYASFEGVLKGAAAWRPGETIDIEGHSAVEHEDPLVVVDPVDPRRNVAAALTIDKMFQFAAASRCFLKGPSPDFFFPEDASPLSDTALLEKMEDRGSTFILIDFRAPDVVEDVLYPQLRKAEESLRAVLARHGFSVLRSDAGCHEGNAAILLEMEVGRLPRVAKREGPPAWEDDHVVRFLAAHPHPLSGPYINEGRVAVEEERKYTRAEDLLRDEMRRLSLGKHLTEAARCGHNIYVGPELIRVKDGEFRAFMASYLEARLRIC